MFTIKLNINESIPGNLMQSSQFYKCFSLSTSIVFNLHEIN